MQDLSIIGCSRLVNFLLSKCRRRLRGCYTRAAAGRPVSGISMQRVSVGQRISDGLSGHSDARRPATHIRRGHWHSYWVGSKKDAANRRKVLKWVPPVLVGENSSELRYDVNIVAVD